MRLFKIIGPNGPVETRLNFAYKTLGDAKTAAKLYIKHLNKNLPAKSRSELHKFTDYEIIEYELLEKMSHPL